MPNNFDLVSKHVTLLDEQFRLESKTNVLESGSEIVRMGAKANEFLIPKYDLDGLADYSRTDGYADGSANLEWESKKPNYDRGRTFSVDAMDNDETIDQAFGLLASQFMKHKVVPEMDAMRFATYAGTTGINSISETFADANAICKSLMNANSIMDEAEIGSESRYLFITPTLHNMVKALDSYKSRSMLEGYAQIIDVPQARFYTAIDLLDGKTTGETLGGYKKSASGKNINYMIIYKPAVLQFTKHIVSKVISPAENQTMDAWKFFYRAYGLTDVFDNKVKGIYCSYGAA
ncbi:MAG: hypothetical protein IJZ64_00055 [Ruminococcus sp.]|nr:hypothetical protein [Ruminococcus sp.]